MASRRDVLRMAALTAAGAATQTIVLPSAVAQTLPTTSVSPPQRTGRIAHLTDVHVQPERGAEAGFAACLQHVQTFAKPDLILFGGDNVFNVSDTDAARTAVQRAGWQRVLKAELSTPHRSAIGNHDIPQMKKLEADKANEDAAKAWPCEQFGLDQRYYAFDQFGWRILVLDSVRVGGAHGYAGRLDETQFAWLKDQLDAAATARVPVLVMSHIPIVCVVGMFDGGRTTTGDWDIPRSYVHIDAVRLHDLFVASGVVKLCISGHAHQVDHCLFDGVTYACNGAVCGNWWKGVYHHSDSGYATIDLFDDGLFDVRYHTYGWTARPM